MAGDLLSLLAERVLVSDGATGTMLYAAGVPLDRPLPELNLSRPALVRSIHGAYVAAGSDIIQTNTFGANRAALARHGLADRVNEVNVAGARIAAAAGGAAARRVLIAGAIGPLPGNRRAGTNPSDVVFEQVAALVQGGVEVLLFETFGDLDELAAAIAVARATCELPIIAQMSFVDDRQTLAGDRPDAVARRLEAAGANVIGVNCTLGPAGVLQVIRQLALHTALPLAAQPNAGQPFLMGGEFRFAANPDYFAGYARRLVDEGVAIVGGCCGTTPLHIEAIAREVRGLLPPPRPPARTPAESHRTGSGRQATDRPNAFAEKLAAGHFVTVCEMRPPVGGEVELAMHEARLLQQAGADAIMISAALGPRDQVSTVTLAMLIQERVGIDTILTVTTWDKSSVSLQADLLGAYAFGIRNVLCRTGRPPSHSSYPSLGGVWDVDSIGLIAMLHALNQGRDGAGVPVGKPTTFFVGTRVGSYGEEGDNEYAYARRKVASDVNFLATPPVFDLDAFFARLDMIGAAGTPVLMGVLPLRDRSHAEVLRQEMPEVSIPDSVLARVRAAPDDGSAVGGEIARELVLAAKPRVQGILLTSDASVEQMVALLHSLHG